MTQLPPTIEITIPTTSKTLNVSSKISYAAYGVMSEDILAFTQYKNDAIKILDTLCEGCTVIRLDTGEVVYTKE